MVAECKQFVVDRMLLNERNGWKDEKQMAGNRKVLREQENRSQCEAADRHVGMLMSQTVQTDRFLSFLGLKLGQNERRGNCDQSARTSLHCTEIPANARRLVKAESMSLSPDLRFWMWLLFQDVADYLHVDAAGSLSSGPSGPSITGQPVGTVEGHTQERIQRPGECLQGFFTKWRFRGKIHPFSEVHECGSCFIYRPQCTTEVKMNQYKPGKFTASVLIRQYFTARFCFNRLFINLLYNSFVISRTQLCVNKLQLQVLQERLFFFVGVH